ncbi:MAG: PLP-dependent aspartate aminotransferase family protein [bacterium]
MKFSTRALHVGKEPDESTGAVKPNICLSSTFKQNSPGQPIGGYDYSRSGNPTREALERNLASLENDNDDPDKAYGLAFSSGLATTSTLLFSFLKNGDHIICSDDVYGGTFRLITGKDYKGFQKFGIECDYVDMANEETLAGNIRENTKLIWIETPTNPLLKLADIQSITATTKSNGIITVVDNTFMSPYFQKPLSLGADIVIHSTTKYIGGHSDVVGGALVTKNTGLYERCKHYQNALGAVPSPFDCFMTLRGIDTLSIRMEKHQANALQIATFLESHPSVEKAIYPGLKSHPQYELGKRQMSGFGGMVSFYIKGALGDAKRFLENVHLFTLAESLGGTESLVEHPAIMTHASLPENTRNELGISDTLIRLSVGVEDVEDLIEDLDRALKSKG